MNDGFLVGAAEIDITPPVGTALAGSLRPRISEGIEDPLTVKAVVLESGGTKLAYVLLDLVKLYRKEGDAAVAAASERTGIPAGNIVWAASHTHTGPYTGPIFGAEEGGVDKEWLASVPLKFAAAVKTAHDNRRPARMSMQRGFCYRVGHNRRFRLKDGRAINTWNLARVPDDVQCLGTAGPIDPEIGILCFDDQDGIPIAVLWHYTLHTNTNFGKYFSADYPAVVGARLRERFGPATVPLFMPGACADINCACAGRRYRVVGDILADEILARLANRKPCAEAPRLKARKAEVVVPYRDFTADQEERIRASGWPEDVLDVFRSEIEIMRREGVTEARTIVQAWRIGDVGFVSLPGELFVEWGLRIKRESPFPWTFPVELGGDYVGYLVTHEAWEAGGYESLTCRSARVSVEGVTRMVDTAIAELSDLW